MRKKEERHGTALFCFQLNPLGKDSSMAVPSSALEEGKDSSMAVVSATLGKGRLDRVRLEHLTFERLNLNGDTHLSLEPSHKL